MMTSPLSAGTSSSTWCDSSLYRNRPTTSSAHTMEPMHSDAWDALMRRLDGSTEYAVCSTNCWHTCTTSAANTQNSRLCSGGGNPHKPPAWRPARLKPYRPRAPALFVCGSSYDRGAGPARNSLRRVFPGWLAAISGRRGFWAHLFDVAFNNSTIVVLSIHARNRCCPCPRSPGPGGPLAGLSCAGGGGACRVDAQRPGRPAGWRPTPCLFISRSCRMPGSSARSDRAATSSTAPRSTP